MHELQRRLQFACKAREPGKIAKIESPEGRRRPAGFYITPRPWISSLLFCAFANAAIAADFVRSGGPYVPTPQGVVDEMLAVAGVSRDDFVIDLGSGDGRIVLTAASRYQARGKGVDIDPELVDQSNKEVQRRGLGKLIRFEQGDALKTRIEEATVVTLYLLPELMHALRDRLYKELGPGARVVSHDFRFNDWMPDRTVTIDVPEKYGSRGAWQSNIFLWIVPAKIAGRWRAAIDDGNGEHYVLSFSQSFQRIEGEALVDGVRVALEGAQIEGKRIRFLLPGTGEDAGTRREFTGTIDGEAIQGTIVSYEGSVPWHATREPAPVAARSTLQ